MVDTMGGCVQGIQAELISRRGIAEGARGSGLGRTLRGLVLGFQIPTGDVEDRRALVSHSRTCVALEQLNEHVRSFIGLDLDECQELIHQCGLSATACLFY